MSENVVELDGPHMTSQYGAYGLHAGSERPHARLHAHAPGYPHDESTRTHTLCNIYYFPTATIGKQMRLSVTSYVHCLVQRYIFRTTRMSQVGKQHKPTKKKP